MEFKLDRDIDHHHSWLPFEIGVIPSVRLSVFCPFVRQNFRFGLQLENGLSNRTQIHYHIEIPFEIGEILSVHLSVFCKFVCQNFRFRSQLKNGLSNRIQTLQGDGSPS